MSDIEKDLRALAAHSRWIPEPYRLAWNAADEIAHLRAQLATAREALRAVVEAYPVAAGTPMKDARRALAELDGIGGEGE